MIERLRRLAGRPIAERERRGAFAIAAAVLLAAAALLLLAGDGSLTAPPPALREPPGPPASQPPPAPAAPPRGAPEAAAARFLRGYLPFLYGRGGAAAIGAASPRLIERLVRSRVRVSPAARERRPRIVAIGAHRLGPGRVALTARIGDGGVAEYPIALTLARRSGRWLVVSVGGG